MRNREQERIWDNPEIRKAFWAVAGMFLFFTLLLAGYWHWSTVRLQESIHNRNLAVIGRLATLHPEWKDEAAASFSKVPAPEELAAGRTAAERFGYDKRLPLSFDTDFSRHDRSGIAALTLAGILLLTVSVLLILHAYRRLYRTIDSYASLAERIVEGEFHLKAYRPAEGAFSKLAHQFNQMSNRLEQTVERLQQEKDTMKQLLSDISHQLKTPLSSLKMFNELLQDGAGEDETVRKDFLGKSEAQIEKMGWLIRQLLTVARVEAGSVSLRMEQSPLLPTIEAAIRALSAQRERKRVHINVNAGGNQSATLPHDPEWLAEAFANILKNSIEHTPEGGRIDIGLQDSAVLARVVIRDEGKGIAKEDLPNIFRRFNKGSGGRPGSGTGIGLAFAKAIIERHGGIITVISEAGNGTAMTLTFPKEIGTPSGLAAGKESY